MYYCEKESLSQHCAFAEVEARQTTKIVKFEWKSDEKTGAVQQVYGDDAPKK